MAAYLGKDGHVEVSSDDSTYTDLGEIRGFSVEETSESIETTVMGLTSRRYAPTYKAFTGSIDVLYDMDDAGQDIATVGSTIYFKFFPEPQDTYGSADTGDEVISGQGVITGRSINASYDGLVEMSLSIQGTGDLTFGTVS